MSADKSYTSLLDYYRRNQFNPVPIGVEEQRTWETHCVRRRTLYERHLGIPLGLLRDRAVIEFGPNSGENALVLALAGAHLTLVEPNEQVLPRLRALFDKFGLQQRIREIRSEGIDTFTARERYDVAIAEGFLYCLPNRDALVRKLVGLLAPGGVGVLSFNDRYGGLIEFTKRVTLWRACRLADADPHGPDSLRIAETLFGEDFARLNASRPFAAWWKDTLVNPFTVGDTYWSYPEIIPVIEQAGGEWLGTSPLWGLQDHFAWYKNAPAPAERHALMLEAWRRVFAYILTGVKPRRLDAAPASPAVLQTVADLIAAISAYASDAPAGRLPPPPTWPAALDAYLSANEEPVVRAAAAELKALYAALAGNDGPALIAAYRAAAGLRTLWGTAYHYLSFVKAW